MLNVPKILPSVVGWEKVYKKTTSVFAHSISQNKSSFAGASIIITIF